MLEVVTHGSRGDIVDVPAVVIALRRSGENSAQSSRGEVLALSAAGGVGTRSQAPSKRRFYMRQTASLLHRLRWMLKQKGPAPLVSTDSPAV
jgi:hypothetical protein